MPVTLKPELEELIKALPANQQAAQRKIFEEVPEFATNLGDGVMRQSDYSKKSAEVQTQKKALDDGLVKQREWFANNKTVYDEAQARAEAAEAESQRLKALADEAASRAAGAAEGEGVHVDEEKLAATILSKISATGGYVTKKDLETATTEGVKKQLQDLFANERKQFLEDTFPKAMNTILTSNEIAFNHQREFGKPFDKEMRTKLSNYMTEHKLVDPQKAYDELMAPERKTVEIEAEVQKRLQAERSRDVPGGSSGQPVAGPGPLTIAYSRDEKVNPLAGKDVVIGDGQAGNAAAAEMRAEGKF